MKIAEDLVKNKNRASVTAPADTSVAEALALMARENVGCLLVTENGEITGIWTERDFARDVTRDGFDIASTPIARYMSKPLITCQWNASVYSLVDKFLGLRIRHLVVMRDGRHLGLISAGDAMRATIYEKDHELAKANARMSWEYYEDWKF